MEQVILFCKGALLVACTTALIALIAYLTYKIIDKIGEFIDMYL